MRLIDADALIRDIDNSAGLGGALGKVVECVKLYAKFMVQTAQTIEERKKGKWIKRGSWYCCSECGTEMFFTGLYDENQHYCYNCGADMRGGDDEES